MDKYSKVKEIGKGSFGIAVLCQRKSDGKQCVIKHISLKQMPQREVTRTLQESELLARLRHPNIVALFESFIDRATQKLAIVMEFANGGDLEAYLKKRRGRPIPESEALQIFVQMCLAIKHIHDRKILHRDLKCQNVFLTSSGVVKVGDFGIAKVLKNTRELANTRIGTPYYMSPELMENKRYNSKTDIWSLGIILYEMLCLRLPFEGRSMNELIRNIIRATPAPISSTFTKEIRDLVSKMLSKSTSSRPGVNSILSLDIMQRRISSFLDEATKKAEFSHTILHGQNIMAKAKLAPQVGSSATNASEAAPKPPVSRIVEARKVVATREQNVNPFEIALADARKKAGEAERRALMAAQEKQKQKEREKQMEREKEREKEREARRKELALREKKRAEEAIAARERQRRMQAEAAAIKERRRLEEARALAAKKAAAAKAKELKDAAMAKNAFYKAHDNKPVGAMMRGEGVAGSAAKQNRIYKSDYQLNPDIMVRKLVDGKAVLANKPPPPPPPRVAPAQKPKPAVPRQAAVGVSRQQQQVLQQAAKGVRKPLVSAKALPHMQMEMGGATKDGIDRVMARIRKESEKRIDEREKMAARGRARIAEKNRIPSAAGAVPKVCPPSPSQSYSKSSNTGPNAKINNKKNLKLSLEDVMETSQEFIQSLSPKNIPSKKKVIGDTDDSTVSSDITVSETHGEGDSLADERDDQLKKKKQADVSKKAPSAKGDWLGNLEQRMGDLQKHVKNLKCPSNGGDEALLSPKQAAAVNPPPPPPRLSKIAAQSLKANAEVNAPPSSNDLNQRKANRERGRSDLKAFLKQQKIQTPDSRPDGIILSPEGSVPLNLPKANSPEESRDRNKKKSTTSQSTPVMDDMKEEASANPSRLVKGAGKEAIKIQRDAERAQLKEMIQAGRRAKAADTPVVVECLEVEDGGSKESKLKEALVDKPNSSAWAAILGESTIAMEVSTNVDDDDVSCDHDKNNDSKISLNSVTKEQLDIDEVIEFDDSEDDDEDIDNGEDNLKIDMNADTDEMDDSRSIEKGDTHIEPTPQQVAAEFADMQDLVECMKVAADVAMRTDTDDADDDEFEEEDSDCAEDEDEADKDAVQAWIAADNGDLSREDIEFFTEEGVDVSMHGDNGDNGYTEDEADIVVDYNDDSAGSAEEEDKGNMTNMPVCPPYATIDPNATKLKHVKQENEDDGDEFESADEWSKDEAGDSKDEEVDPLQKPINLSQNENLKDESTKLLIHLNENLGKDNVTEVIDLLESINTESSEEELLAEVEKVIGAQGLFYLDDFFKLLTCMPPRQ